MNQNKSKLQARDLVTIGIFTALYLIICIIFEVLGGIAPLVWVFMPTFLSLFCGPVYMTLANKVQKAGVPLLMGLITSLIFSVRGGYFFLLIATAVIAGIIAEVVRKKYGYSDVKGNILSYAVFSLGMIGNLLPIWVFRDDFLSQMVVRGMPQDYVDAMRAATPVWVLIVMIAATFLVAFIGGKIGNRVVEKHLRKAGMV